MSTKWKYRLAITTSMIVTSALCWLAWISFPREIVVITGMIIVVVGGFSLDAYVSRRATKSATDEGSE